MAAASSVFSYFETAECAPQLEAAIAYYLTKESPSGAQCFRYLEQLCEQHKVAAMGRSTFYQRLNEIDSIEACYHRRGPLAAAKERRMVMQQYQVAGVFSQTQSDALHAPIAIVDDLALEYSGLPIFYNTLDVCSRSCIGWFIDVTSGGETAASIIECYKHAYLPKINDRIRYGLENDYVMFGPPSVDVHDGGSGYLAADTQLFRLNARVSNLVISPGKPYKNAFIESYNRTVAQMFLRGKPGFLPPKNTQSGDFYRNLQREATLTASEIKVLYARWVVDEYHQRPHSGLCGETPANVYRAATEKQLWAPSALRNVDWLRTAGGVLAKGTIQEHRGIQHDNRFYQNDELMALRRYMVKRSDGKASVAFYHYPTTDLTVIKVADARKPGAFIFVPYVRPAQGHAAIDDVALQAAQFADHELARLSKLSSEEIIARAKERNKQLEKERRKRRQQAQPVPLSPSDLTPAACRNIAAGKTRINPLTGIVPSQLGRDDLPLSEPPTAKSIETFSRDDFSTGI